MVLDGSTHCIHHHYAVLCCVPSAPCSFCLPAPQLHMLCIPITFSKRKLGFQSADSLRKHIEFPTSKLLSATQVTADTRTSVLSVPHFPPQTTDSSTFSTKWVPHLVNNFRAISLFVMVETLETLCTARTRCASRLVNHSRAISLFVMVETLCTACLHTRSSFRSVASFKLGTVTLLCVSCAGSAPKSTAIRLPAIRAASTRRPRARPTNCPNLE